MRTVCLKCGHPNDIGRLFCTKCGAKLDLTHVSDSIERGARGIQVRGLLTVVVVPVLLIALAAAGLAFWPCPSLADKSARGKAENVESLLRRLSTVVEQGTDPYPVRPPVKKEDLNAWLAAPAVRGTLRSLSADWKPGRLTLRVGASLGPFTVLKGNVRIPAIPLTYDFVGTFSNGPPSIASARVGHLPMLGPLLKPARRLGMRPLAARQREIAVLAHLADIKADGNQLSATLVPPRRE